MSDSNVIYTCIFLLFVLLIVVFFLLNRVRHFKQLSETDQMTLLLNYRGLCRSIEKLIKHHLPFSLAIIDIDNFRVFNKNSYQLGDDVLKEFASLLNNSFSMEAILARFRIGDEFILVFQNKNLEQVTIKMKEFKEKCKNYPFNSLIGFSMKSITFTEGIVETNSETDTIETLFSEVENSLKINKGNKRYKN
jgi:diguanylate cyclase (GGDEF)-like protein